ncbi:hypothetical protein Tco_1162780 [Tanacetum coccineum]
MHGGNTLRCRGSYGAKEEDVANFKTKIWNCGACKQLVGEGGESMWCFYACKDKMDDSDLTMEEYIDLEAEKARRHGRTFNWETATYGKVSYFDDFDYLKDFENEFPAIVYNDALTSGSEIPSEPTVRPLDNNEIDFRISFDESDDDDYICIYDKIMAQILVRAQRHPWLRYEVEGYTDEIVQDFEHRLAGIFSRRIHRVRVLDFGGLTEEMAMSMDARLSMEHIDAQGQVVFNSHAWRRLFEIRGPLVRKLMLEFFSTCREIVSLRSILWEIDGIDEEEEVASFRDKYEHEIATDGFRVYWDESFRVIASKGDLRGYWDKISSSGDFLTIFPSYIQIRDLLRRLCHRLIAHTIAGRGQAPDKVTRTDLYFLRSIDREAVNLPYLLGHYLFSDAEGRKRGAQMSGGHFIARLADHFGMLIEETLQGATVVVRELTGLDLDELSRLHICERMANTRAWVAPGLERQQVSAAGALAVDEVVWDVSTPVQAPQPPPLYAVRTMPQRTTRLEEEVHGLQESLGEQHEIMDAMSRDFSRFTTWTVGRLSQLLDASGSQYDDLADRKDDFGGVFIFWNSMCCSHAGI